MNNKSNGKSRINGGFGIWESGFMNAFKFGQRYGLFGCRQAAELTPLSKHVGHAEFQLRQQLAATEIPKHICRSIGYGITENRGFPTPTHTDRTRPHRARLGVLSVKALRGASVGAR
jgi:hypothetical protein